ncbi:MAG TPA: hypothetical protein VLG40_00065 [Candidatus Saccharimonas sp.]|nr:hypothetical protein [Candidatus Saccharimonas sp.]
MEPNTSSQQPEQQTSDSASTRPESQQPASPPTPPTPQPVIPQATPPQPSMTTSPTVPSVTLTVPLEPPRMQNGKKRIIIVSSIVVLVMVLTAYFWLVPMSQASAYKSRVQTAYGSQHEALQATIDAFTQKDVFKGTAASESQQGEQDLSQVGQLIDKAQTQTNNLQQQAGSPFLPGATALGVGKDAEALQPKVSDYITKSKAFLDDFQKLDKYIGDFNTIGKNQSPPAIKALNGIVGPTKTDLLPQTQAAIAPMGALVDALRKLGPPEDLKDYTNKLIDAFAQAQTAVTGVNQGLKDGDDNAVRNNSLQMTTAGVTIQLLSLKNPLDSVQSQDSTLQKELAAAKDASVSF